MIERVRMVAVAAPASADTIRSCSTPRGLSAWTAVPLIFLAGRILQVVFHYLVPTPYGEPLIRLGTTEVFEALPPALGASLVIVVLGRLLAHGKFAIWGRTGERTAAALFAAFCIAYLVIAELDLEMMRRLGQHLSLGFCRVYWFPSRTRLHILTGDARGLFAAVLVTAIPIAGIVAAIRSPRGGPIRWRSTGLLAVPTLLSFQLILIGLRHPARFRTIQPPLVTFLQGSTPGLDAEMRPSDFEQGVRLLHRALRRREADYPVPWYPLWRPVANEEKNFEAFRAQPLEQKPDVLLVLLESPQAWEFDLRREDVCKRYKTLCGLFHERGTFFPYAQSVGFPSMEGYIGVHLGIWSHPTVHLLSRYRNLRTISLPQIMGRAGYVTRYVSAANPNPYGLQSWFDKWYQHWECQDERLDDWTVSKRILDLQEELPADKPRFVVFNTGTMHAPWTYPGSDDRPERGFHARYVDSARYFDQALGRILGELKKSPRWSRTIVVVVGDHSITGPWLGFHRSRAGTPSAAETWIPMLVAAPGRRGGEVREETVSQLDVPPTVLALAGIKASNHFPGRALLSKDGEALEPAPAGVFSFRRTGLAFTTGDVRYQLATNDPTYLLKTQYADVDLGCADPEPYGCYRNGTALAVEPQDAELGARVRLIAQTYAQLLERDQIAPPQAILPYR